MKKPVLVIMAAGMGSRYGGLKQIDPIDEYGNIIMDFSIYDARRAGFEKVVFIIKKENEELFREAVGDRIAEQMEVAYVFQELSDLPDGFSVPEGRVKPWGTGHAILSCRNAVDGPFAVINADDYYGPEAFRVIYDYLMSHEDDRLYRFAMVGYQVENTLTENGSVARGVCETDAEGHLVSITERTKIERTDGKISSWGNVVDNKLNITMDASDPQNGYQVLRFSKIDNYENENWINYAFTSGANSLNEIVVKNGRLDIAMYDGMKASSLSMEGGVFSAAGDNSEMGKVVFDKIVFSGGTIYFDIFEVENDSLKINGSIEKVSDSSKLTLEMSVNEYDLREWLAGEDSKSVELITFSSEGSNVTAEDFSLKLLDGVSGEIAMDEADGMISLSVNLGLVPEPEAVASVLAALAIIAACFRKRA